MQPSCKPLNLGPISEALAVKCQNPPRHVITYKVSRLAQVGLQAMIDDQDID